MRIARKIMSLVVVVTGCVLGIWFYLENMDPVVLHFFGYAIPGFQLALWLLVFFVGGVILGLSVSAVQALRYQMHLQLLRKQLRSLKQKSSTRVA